MTAASASDALPDDSAALKAIIARQRGELSQQREEIERLRLLVAKLRRVQFGRRSEQMGTLLDQLELKLEELEAGSVETGTELEPMAAPVPRKSARKPLPDHLPRESRVHAPEHACCPDCGGVLRPIGQDISERLEYVPARFKVIRQIRPKLACSSCDAIVQASAPSRPIARGYAGPGLLAHVLVSTVITCRCTASPRSMPAKGSRSSARRWPTGGAKRVRCCNR